MSEDEFAKAGHCQRKGQTPTDAAAPGDQGGAPAQNQLAPLAEARDIELPFINSTISIRKCLVHVHPPAIGVMSTTVWTACTGKFAHPDAA